MPLGKPTTVNVPSPAVVVFDLAPVAWFLIEIAAAGMTEPELSTIKPLIVAVVLCAHASAAPTRSAHAPTPKHSEMRELGMPHSPPFILGLQLSNSPGHRATPPGFVQQT